jgi:hypothetical protein
MSQDNSPERSSKRTRSSRFESESLSDVVSIRSPEEARHSVSVLNEWADDEENRLRRAIRAATGAANRARASTKRRTRPLSDKERSEMMRVAQTYRTYVERASRKLARLRDRAARRAGAAARPGRRGRTIFFPAKHKTLAEIITIRSPEEAREAVRKLGEWADDDPDRVRTAIRSATLAANRALVSTRRRTRPLSPQERKEMLQVAEVYRSYTRQLSKKLDQLKRREPRDSGSRPGAYRPSESAGHPTA